MKKTRSKRPLTKLQLRDLAKVVFSKKRRSLIKKNPAKDIACLRGKEGWINLLRDDLTRQVSLTVKNNETGRIVNVRIYPHEAMRIYDFLGKVLA